MAIKFISHKEIAFRNLLGMLRTPPVAVMNYYTNLFLSARFVFGEQPEKVKYLEKEMRRVECLVGVQRTPESDTIQKALDLLYAMKKGFEQDRQRIESLFELSDEQTQKELEAMFHDLSKQMADIDNREYYLLFKLTPLMTLKVIETYMDNNMDLKSFFKENGRIITQMELSAELEKVKIWIYQEAVELMPYIRFTKLE